MTNIGLPMVLIVNEHQNMSTAGLNCQAGYATGCTTSAFPSSLWIHKQNYSVVVLNSSVR